MAFALPARPTAKEMLALAEPWRPWRAVAARILWTYYRTAIEIAKSTAKKTVPRKSAAKKLFRQTGATQGPRQACRAVDICSARLFIPQSLVLVHLDRHVG